MIMDKIWKIQMKINKFNFTLDSEVIGDELINYFNLKNGDIRYSRESHNNLIDFVGFVVREEKILISLPKHYAHRNDLVLLDENDIELLFSAIFKEQLENADLYIDNNEFECSFPFRSFYEIYNYYIQFGLYKETEVITQASYSGNISWKDTIRKSSNIISNGNLIFLPFFIKQTLDKQVFLSECMTFAINYTLRNFPYFVKGRSPKDNTTNFDYWNNKEYIVGRLRKIYSNTFKDIDKKLIISLIDFFSLLPQKGAISIKHFNFENVWEKAVEKYLNDYFIGINDSGLYFSTKNNYFDFKKGFFKVDKVHSNNNIQPDHYFFKAETNEQFIFDSKYYITMKGLDYKQVAYHSFLKKTGVKTYNALIFPTEFRQNRLEKHFELKEEFVRNVNHDLIIWSCYLNMKQTLINYVF